MKALLQIISLALAWTAGAQGTLEAVQNYSTGTGGILNGTLGWTFRPTNYVEITELGCFSYLFQNPDEAIQVGLWDNNGALVASNQITTASTPFNQSFYASISPVVLVPFAIYHLGAFSTNGFLGVQVFVPGGPPGDFVSLSTPVDLRGSAQGTGGFVFPPESNGADGSIILAPNFRFRDTVPEPAALSLLGLALLGWISRKRR